MNKIEKFCKNLESQILIAKNLENLGYKVELDFESINDSISNLFNKK